MSRLAWCLVVRVIYIYIYIYIYMFIEDKRVLNNIVIIISGEILFPYHGLVTWAKFFIFFPGLSVVLRSCFVERGPVDLLY
jgi:hypothetical protein